jgi:antitoxin component YwqK of YwqJK toxin-antitoxin module
MLITSDEMSFRPLNHTFTGLDKFNHDNGTKKSEHRWVSGKRHGIWNWWYDDGDELYVLNYLNDALEGEGLIFSYD